MTIRKIYREACKQLEDAGITDAATDAWILLEHVTGLSRAAFYADGDHEISEAWAESYAKLIEERKKRIPVQHLTGEQEFMGLSFKVSASVLVPRQDTEILVEEAEKLLSPDMRILDMCTGSGCIAISLAVRNPQTEITAVDISNEALCIAKENAKRHKVQIEMLESDMFSFIEGTYDMILSNPPYIPTGEIEKLQTEVKLHDPFGALDGKEDGLYFYRILAGESGTHLRPGGVLCMEIGHDQSKAVEELLREQGFGEVRTKKDLAGLDRVVVGMYNKQ